MNREEAIVKLKRHETELKALGVDHLYLFGSTARDEAGEDSDIDLFFDHEKGRIGLYELIDVKESTTNILGGRADIMTRASLHPALRKRIEELGGARVLMAQRIVSPNLGDIVEAIDRIRSSLTGISLEDFENNWEKRWVVERGVEIISEASRRLPHELKDRNPGIPWRKVAGIGNVIRHDYERVAPDVLWKLIQDDLPTLEKVCRAELSAALAREREG